MSRCTRHAASLCRHGQRWPSAQGQRAVRRRWPPSHGSCRGGRSPWPPASGVTSGSTLGDDQCTLGPGYGDLPTFSEWSPPCFSTTEPTWAWWLSTHNVKAESTDRVTAAETHKTCYRRNYRKALHIITHQKLITIQSQMKQKLRTLYNGLERGHDINNRQQREKGFD